MDDNAGQCRFIAYRNRYSPDTILTKAANC